MPNGVSNENKPLKLGIYWTDNVVTPHPPISRGLKLVVDAVKNAGHEVGGIKISFASNTVNQVVDFRMETPGSANC